jgi:hypothetical protein
MGSTRRITRLEINSTEQKYSFWDNDSNISYHLEDDGRTLKIDIDKHFPKEVTTEGKESQKFLREVPFEGEEYTKRWLG